MSTPEPVVRVTGDTDTWPQPQWMGRMKSAKRAALWWRGQRQVETGDGGVIEVRMIDVEVDLLGRLVPSSWECWWEEDAGSTHSVIPPWDGLADFWQEFATESWAEAISSRVEEHFSIAWRESRSGLLVMYRSRKAAKEAVDEIGPVRHAYSQPTEDLHAALRLAESWKGTYEEFVETLPKVLGRPGDSA